MGAYIKEVVNQLRKVVRVETIEAARKEYAKLLKEG